MTNLSATHFLWSKSSFRTPSKPRKDQEGKRERRGERKAEEEEERGSERERGEKKEDEEGGVASMNLTLCWFL